MLCALYEGGLLVDPDEECFKYLKLCADCGNLFATRNIGYMFLKGLGVKEDLKRCFQYFKIAANRGDIESQSSLGLALSAPFISDISDAKALDSSTLSSQQKYNLKQAVKYLHLAANKNDTTAQARLGLLYLHGIGVEKDLTQAKNFFQLASVGGDQDATKNLQNISQVE